jgi:Ca2+-transporting ATPase
LTSLQILWANLIIDTPPALALGVQPAADNVMSRLPRNPDQPMFTAKMLFLIFGQGAILMGLALTVFIVDYVVLGVEAIYPFTSAFNRFEVMEGVFNPYAVPDALYAEGLLHARSHCFMTLAIMHLTQAFMSRDLTRSFFSMPINNNVYLLWGAAISVAFLVMCMYIPGWNTTFDQSPLGGYEWIIIGACVVVQVLFVETFKWLLRKNFFRAPKPLKEGEKEWYSSV